MSKEKLIPKLRFDEFVNEENWIKYELGNNAIIKGRLGWKNLKQEEYVNRGPAMIAGRHINNGIINWNKVDHIPLWRYEESPDIMLKENDIIFSKDGSLGNPAIIKQLPSLATINATMMLVRVSDKINSEFFYQILNGSQFNELINIKVSGSSIPHLFQADMEKFSFYSPEILEQEKIGNFFKKLDQMIQLQQSKVNKVKDIKAAYLSEMFPKEGEEYPKKRFRGFTEPWKKRKLKDMTEYKNGKGHEDRQSNCGKYELINLNSISIDGGLKPSGKYIDDVTDTLLENDLVMVLSDVGHGDLLGRVALIPENNRFVLNQRVALLRPNDTVNPQFLFTHINVYQEYFGSQGAGMSQLNISKRSVENFTSYIPNLREQEKIGQFFNNLDKQISFEEEKLAKLEKLKQAYLNDMFV